MLDIHFIEERERQLRHRRQSKLKILQMGGEQALSHSHKDIARIDFALKRIVERQYGLCTNCGCPIGVARLRVIPETPFCTSCAQNIEAQ